MKKIKKKQAVKQKKLQVGLVLWKPSKERVSKKR